MKNSPLLKTGLRLLVIAGTLTPFAALSATSMVAATDEGAFYDNLRHIQTAQNTAQGTTSSMHGAMHGAQGPVRTDFAEPTWSFDEGSIYDNLKKIQDAPKPM